MFAALHTVLYNLLLILANIFNRNFIRFRRHDFILLHWLVLTTCDKTKNLFIKVGFDWGDMFTQDVCTLRSHKDKIIFEISITTALSLAIGM